MAHTRLTDVFRHVGRLDLGLELLRPFPRAYIGRSVGQWLFPNRPSYLQTFCQHFRRGATAYRIVREDAGSPAHPKSTNRRRRVDKDGRIQRLSQSPSPFVIKRQVPSLRDAILRYRGTSGGGARSNSTAISNQTQSHTTPGNVASRANRSIEDSKSASYHNAGQNSLTRPSGQQIMHRDISVSETTKRSELLRSTVVALRGRAIVEEQRRVTLNLERSREDFQREVEEAQRALSELTGRDGDQTRSIRRTRRELNQAQESLNHHLIALEVARERLALGESRITSIESRLVREILGNPQSHEVAHSSANTDVIQQRLFDPLDESYGDSEGARPSKKKLKISLQDNGKRPRRDTGNDAKPAGSRSGRYSALPPAIVAIMEKDGDLRARIIEARDVLVDAYLAATNDLDAHRYNYRRRLDMHLSGQDPGLPGWDPSWTREEFDDVHLREWMRLSSALKVAWSDMMKMLSFATKSGIKPPAWQESGFWQPGSCGYSSSVEQEMMDEAPVSDILSWRDDHPLNPAGFQTEHPADWPMYDDQVFEPAPELMPGDSQSCVALEYQHRRNTRYGGPRPVGWTLHAEAAKSPPENNRILTSHFV